MVQHISIRVPWHDNNWNGKVCEHPCENVYCMALKNIHENKKEENELANKEMRGIENRLPCIEESVAFMSENKLERTTIHPYALNNSKEHRHFRETILEYPPYTLVARPYRWVMRSQIKEIDKIYKTGYKEEYEPNLGFDTSWLQDARNHKAIFDTFYKDVKPEESLCIVYAKQVPFIEESRRIIIGIGKVKQIIDAVEHNYDKNMANPLRALTWETMIRHSIRKNCEDGFIFPYKEMMEYAKEHPEFDMKEITVFAPEDSYGEFSYATEHVKYDSIIDIIMQSIKAFSKIKECIDGPWDKCINWLNNQLEKVWKDRGALPGLGEMFCAIKFRYGMLIAREIKNNYKSDIDYWSYINKVIENPDKYLSEEIAESITQTNKDTYLNLSKNRKELFKLLSRFDITIEQANLIFNQEEREKEHINFTDEEILENPYILYEKTIELEKEKNISIKKVDLAVFPNVEIRKNFPLEEISRVENFDNRRRIRAIIMNILEEASQKGNTILPVNELVREINEKSLDEFQVNRDILDSIDEFLQEEITIKIKNNEKYYKLNRYEEIDDLIRKQINKRINNQNAHEIEVDWRKKIDEEFGEIEDENENKARTEKSEALKMLAKSSIAVLVGGAGTGKTTVLSFLCQEPQIRDAGILLLAPTGKARVRMQETIGNEKQKFKAQTIAQFLMKSGRYNGKTGRYRLSNLPQENVPDTVIIDECSMLTEEMLGAVIQATRRAKRIILVGDENQLPPIGAGRPFIDLISYLTKSVVDGKWPCIRNNYAKLQITRRQKESNRLDVELSKWYMKNEKHRDETVFERMQRNEDKNISFKRWESYEELEKQILETIKEELGMENIDDEITFNKSLGAVEKNGYCYFNLPGCAKFIDEWQILAPVRNNVHGVVHINQLIHEKYRKSYIDLARRTYNKKIPKDLGIENIVYGDKVINVKNEQNKAYPEDINALNYIANGEIGMAASKWGEKQYLHVEYSSQQGYTYSYNPSYGASEDGEMPLELAYALTIHKAQGSQFNTVILVLAEPCRLISKEMMYTALTRQTQKLVILYNDEPYKLRNYSTAEYSEIAKRYTDLFEMPSIVKVSDCYYEDRLIHRTVRGELVRSKSEVIIANMLLEKGVYYEYEKVLDIGGVKKLPDFTIEDAARTYYWEHCGMMNDEEYRKKWEMKKQFYEKNGIIEGENLIVTFDDENGGIDSKKIKEIMDKYF